MATLELDGIHKSFGAEPVLEDVSLSVEAGEFLVLVGPSGCGKSTLLRIIAGLVPASRGRVRLDGEVVDQLDPRQRDVAMVFQNYALYPHMSVRKNLAFPLKLRRVPRERIAAEVRETADLLGLGELLDRKPGTLSGGQMQRVALGRAIIRHPRLFLFDEPLSNLDAKLRGEMRGEIARLHERLRITTIYVTHDQAEAMTMGSRIAVLNGGRLEQEGAPLEVFERPATRFVASFIGSPPMNLIEGRVGEGRFRAGALDLAAPAAAAAGPLVLGVRPHQIRAGGGAAALEVSFVERLGTQTLIECEIGLEEGLRVSLEGNRELAVGRSLALEMPPEALHWFEPVTGRRLSTAPSSAPPGPSL